MSRSKPKLRSLLAILASAGLLTACGGGGGDSNDDNASYYNPGSVLTPVASAGTISGLGSVVLNGIRYETIGASVSDSDDNTTFIPALGLGMTVSIQANQATATTATASVIQVQRGIKGYTSAVGSTATTLSVAGLPVTIDPATLIISDVGGVVSFAALLSASPSQVEVYGLPQSDGTFKATRIEVKSVAAVASSVQLVGVVSNLNTVSKTFSLGTVGNAVTVDYAFSSAVAPAGLANGSVVSVHTLTTATAANYAAAGLYLRSANVTTFNQYATNYLGTSRIGNETNELYGMVSGLTPTAFGCTLQVQGVPTSLSNAVLCNSIINGDYVEVKGQLTNGTLAAYRMEFRTAGGDRNLNVNGYTYNDDSNDDDHDGVKYSRLLTSTSSSNSSGYSQASSSSYEIYGTLSNCAASTCTLTSGGSVLTADLSNAYWEHGYSAASGWVEAKGYMTAANAFKVTKIELKNNYD